MANYIEGGRAPQPYRIAGGTPKRDNSELFGTPPGEYGAWRSSWKRHRMSHPYLGCIHPTHSLVQLKSVVFCDKCYNWSKNALPAAFMSECPHVSPGPVGELPQYRKIVRGKLLCGEYPIGKPSQSEMNFGSRDKRVGF
jgi:hypothetical protein